MGHTSNDTKLECVRIGLTSCNRQKLEKVTSELIRTAQDKQAFVKGPARLPSKNLRIVTRKSPNGNGTSTYDSYEMRIFKRLVTVNADIECIKSIIRLINFLSSEHSVDMDANWIP